MLLHLTNAALVEADLWDQLPADLPTLLALVPQADLYLQDEVQFAFHPTLTRLRSRKGRRGQRLVEAPGDNRKVYGFGLVDWRDGWFDWPCPGLTRRELRIDSSSYWLVCCA